MHIHRYTLILLLPLLFTGSACGQGGDSQVRTKEREKVITSSDVGYLGVSTRDLRPSLAREKNIEAKTGALVTDVVEDSPADKAGITDDDVIVEFNGKAIDDANDLIKAVRRSDPGSKATLVVVRGSQKKTLEATLGSRPEMHTFVMPRIPHIPRAPHVGVRVFGGASPHGLQLMDLNSQLREYFGAPEGKGVLVEKVSKRSAAKDAGFKAGDVILKVGKAEIEDRGDIWDALEDYEGGDSATVEILRKGSRLSLHLEIDESDDVNSYYFRSHTGELDEEALESVEEAMREFEVQSGVMKKQKFNLQKDMEKLKEELRSVGKEIRSRMDTLRNTLRRELKQVVG